MKTLYCILGIIAAELCWSWLVCTETVALVSRLPMEACACNVGSQVIAYEILRVIARKNWNRLFVYAAVFGSTLGTLLVAIR